MTEFIPYDDKYSEQFFDLNIEYLNYLQEIYRKALKITSPPKDYRSYVERVLLQFTAIKPPEGIIYLLISDDRVVGMGAMRKLEEGVGEIKRMYIQPGLQGRVLARR